MKYVDEKKCPLLLRQQSFVFLGIGNTNISLTEETTDTLAHTVLSI